VEAFGGEGTVSVEVTKDSVGAFEVRFHGTYDSIANKHDLTVLVTITQSTAAQEVASADFYQNGGAQADGSEFWTKVYIFKTDDHTLTDLNFSVLVLR